MKRRGREGRKEGVEEGEREGWNRCGRSSKRLFVLRLQSGGCENAARGTHTLTRTLWEWQTQTPSIVYIFPPTTAIVDYTIGLEKLSASERLFDDAHTAVRL